MMIDLNAPVELWRCELPTAEYRACTLQLYNLAERQMESCEVTMLMLDDEGREQARVLYRAHDLHCPPGKTCTMTVPL